MKQEDAIHSTSDSASGAYYRWKDSTSWHYFRYEPIKWRVLSTAGGQAFLLSDMALDDQMCNNNDAECHLGDEQYEKAGSMDMGERMSRR